MTAGGRTLAALAAALGLAGAVAGCGGSGGAGAALGPQLPPEVRSVGPPPVYVAIGASETRGVGATRIGSGWAQRLFVDAFPGDATFVNLGIPGATTAQVAAASLPVAEQIRPSVVTVWLNVDDILNNVPVADYERSLDDLVRRVRGAGAQRVLIANTPELDRLPAYRACRGELTSAECPPQYAGRLPGPQVLDRTVAAYNAAIARIAARYDATLVDLHAEGDIPDQDPQRISADGFHPSDEGHEAIAGAFAAALGPLPAG